MQRIIIFDPIAIIDASESSPYTSPYISEPEDHTATEPPSDRRDTIETDSLYDQIPGQVTQEHSVPPPPRLGQEITRETYLNSTVSSSTNFENPQHYWDTLAEENRRRAPVTPENQGIPIRTTPPPIQQNPEYFPRLQSPFRADTPLPGPSRNQTLVRGLRRFARTISNSLQTPISQAGVHSENQQDHPTTTRTIRRSRDRR